MFLTGLLQVLVVRPGWRAGPPPWSPYLSCLLLRLLFHGGRWRRRRRRGEELEVWGSMG